MAQPQQAQTKNKNFAPINGAVLPAEKSQAISALVKITQALLDLAEKETQALAQNDMLTFAILQDEKAAVTERYAKLSEGFRSRVNEFRDADKNQLNRLENLQKLLAEKTHANNKVVERLYERARTQTQTTLLAAQEIGQRTHIKYPEKDEKTAGVKA